MTDTNDTERMVLIATLMRDADSFEMVGRAAADALFTVCHAAVPLIGQDAAMEAMLKAFNQAMANSTQLAEALRRLARRVERDEMSGHEMAEILARPHYLDRRGYASWTFAPLVSKSASATVE